MLRAGVRRNVASRAQLCWLGSGEPSGPSEVGGRSQGHPLAQISHPSSRVAGAVGRESGDLGPQDIPLVN